MKKAKVNKEGNTIIKSELNIGNLLQFIFVFIVAFIVSFLTIKIVFDLSKNINIGKLLKQRKSKVVFTENINNTYIDPLLLVSYIDNKKNDYLLIDIRSTVEYQAGHIKGAVNGPLYQDSVRVYDSLIKKEDWYRDINKSMLGKKSIIIYGYRADADLILDAANFLKNYLPVKILAVGFYDWKNNFYQWWPGADLGGINMSKYIEPNIEVLPIQPAGGNAPIPPVMR